MSARGGPEVTLAQCDADGFARPFGLRLTDRRLSYKVALWLRRGSHATRECDIARVEAVRLTRRAPWVAWIAGGALASLALLDLALVGLGGRAVAVAVGAAACLAVARRRWVLAWRSDGERHQLVEPLFLPRARRRSLHATAVEITRLLGDGDAFAAEVARRRVANVDAPTPRDAERWLCPDGACVGLLDRDGRCKECGRVVATGYRG